MMLSHRFVRRKKKKVMLGKVYVYVCIYVITIPRVLFLGSILTITCLEDQAND